MNPTKRVEELLDKTHTPADREAAMIFAVLALAQAIENHGSDILEAARSIAFSLEAK